MLTVWSLCWGDKYDDYHVQRLQRAVRENLSHKHEFVCITERDIEGVTCIRPMVDWPGWFGKLQLFSGIATGQNLWFDLDVVITGSLDPFVGYTAYDLASPANWAQSGHGGIQSSVMAWNGWLHRPFTAFDPKNARWPPVNDGKGYWGDQEWLTVLRDREVIDWTPMDPTLVRSYKYHCRNGLPDDCRVVVFHGNPKPEAVKESWFKW